MAKVGKGLEVIVDEIDEDGATCRTWADAPKLTAIFIDEGFDTLSVGDIVKVTVDEAGEYDLGRNLPDKGVRIAKLHNDACNPRCRRLSHGYENTYPFQRGVSDL